MGEVHLTSQRTLFIAVFALVAAPVLAGCAENDNDPGTGGTPAGGTTPATGTPAGTTPASPTTTPVLPTVPVGNVITLKMGAMMPITGELADLGQDMTNGARMAVDEINNATGAGLRIDLSVEDDTTSNAAAAATAFNRLVGQGVTAVVGPCCSGVTAAVLQAAVDSEVVVASPSATSPALTDRENEGFFWRVAPSDAVQGKVLAALVKEDGHDTAHLIIINNAYGTGLARVFTETFEAGGGDVLRTESFNPAVTDYASVVTAVCGQTADALVIVAYIDNGAQILRELNKQNCLNKFQIYGSEGIYKGNGPEGLPVKAGQTTGGAWLAAGVKGTNPESGNLSAFNERFKAKYGHDPAQYSAESYDGVMYVALAALQAKSNRGTDIAANLLKVAQGGVKCNTFNTCAALILAGQDIDYQGQAHDFEYEEDHEPRTGVYSYWRVNQDGQVETIATGKTA